MNQRSAVEMMLERSKAYRKPNSGQCYDFTPDSEYFSKKVYIIGNRNAEPYLKEQKCNHIPISALVVDFHNCNKTFCVPMLYCDKCDRFFVYPSTIQKYIENENTPLLQYSTKTFGRARLDNTKYSIPAMFGYTVRKDKNLTAKQRHKILQNILDYKLMKWLELYELIEGMAALREYGDNMSEAVGKWSEDMDFLLRYRFPDSCDLPEY